MGRNDFVLAHDNYHSLDANRAFMSRGQYLDFLKCEAATVASLRGEWVEGASTALLVGSYVHSWNENKRSEFIAEHPEMFKRDLSLKADYALADKMIETLQNDQLAMYTLEGEKEVILVAEMFGCWWKVMLDAYNPERQRIADLKTTRSITEHYWNGEFKTKVSFVEQYNYVTQAAVYCEAERIAHGREPGDWYDFYIVAVSKQDYPDKAVIDMRGPERYVVELAEIETNMPRILAVKNGKAEAKRCENCNYCRATKQLTGTIHYSEL
jgi:hypothetical protein